MKIQADKWLLSQYGRRDSYPEAVVLDAFLAGWKEAFSRLDATIKNMQAAEKRRKEKEG